MTDGLPAAILVHPDVRRMLLTIRAFTEAGRALAVWLALEMDKAALHPDAAERAAADGLVALLTPVIKAAFSDMGFEAAVLGQQVLGGHGYIREWGMELPSPAPPSSRSRSPRRWTGLKRQPAGWSAA